LSALETYLDRVWKGDDAHTALIAAAESVASVPWDVVQQAGPLARCTLMTAESDLGLTWGLRAVGVDARNAAFKVPAGARYPTFAHARRRNAGAFDTPIEMARRVVAAAIGACAAPPVTALDPACGTGSFLVALAEAGVREIIGTDTDPVALAIARIAVPKAKLSLGDALHGGPLVDLVVGNPPFVPPERQDKALRQELRRRFPWLEGRFDLVIPFAAVAVDRVKPGGIAGLVLPAPAMVQRYGSTLRRRWVERHKIVDLAGPLPFPGAAVDVVLLVLRSGAGPAPLPAFGISPDELLRLESVPFNPDLMPGDVDLVDKIRAASIPLGELFLVDTGLVAHAPGGSRERLLHDEPGENRVRYADARDFFAGEHRWLEYKPDEMHRPKRREMFEVPKIVIQRIRGDQPIRAAIDATGTYVGHTCTVVVPREPVPPVTLERILELVRSPMIDGLVRIERGERLDLYPRDVASFPVPKVWLTNPGMLPERAWGIGAREAAQLLRFARR
jgi:SAM-dependent methyltransferase